MNIGIIRSNPYKETASNKRIAYELERLGHSVAAIAIKNTLISLGEGESSLLHKTSSGLIPVEIDSAIIRLGSGSEMGRAVVAQFVAMDVPVTNEPEAIYIAGDKLLSGIRMAEHGIPTPRTIAPVDIGNKKIQRDVIDLIQEDPTQPIISKTRRGSCGNGVTILESRRSAISHMESKSDPSLVQRMITPSNIDTRVFIIDNRIVASMQRQGDEKEFRANLSKKGSGKKYVLTDAQAELALKTAQASGLGIVGVDIMTDSEAGDFVIEYNSNPGLGIEKITGINVAKKIAKYAVKIAQQEDEE